MEKTLAYAIALLRRDFKAYCQQELSKLGVSLGQLYFLLYIGKYQPCSSKALSDALLHAYERSHQLFDEWDHLALSYVSPTEADAFMEMILRIAEGRKRDQDNSQEETK